jgi:hypothetical protein
MPFAHRLIVGLKGTNAQGSAWPLAVPQGSFLAAFTVCLFTGLFTLLLSLASLLQEEQEHPLPLVGRIW